MEATSLRHLFIGLQELPEAQQSGFAVKVLKRLNYLVLDAFRREFFNVWSYLENVRYFFHISSEITLCLSGCVWQRRHFNIAESFGCGLPPLMLSSGKRLKAPSIRLSIASDTTFGKSFGLLRTACKVAKNSNFFCTIVDVHLEITVTMIHHAFVLMKLLLDFSKFGVPKSFEDRNMISNASSNEAKTLHRKIGQMMV